tara:strand:+ start:222 stop:593 length:372 start_codon:yes stop_codon:yes gene_type:complete
MAVVLGQKVKVELYIPEAEDTIAAIFPSYDDESFSKAITQLLKTRFKQVGRRVENRTQEARIAFFDQNCEAVEGIEYMDESGEAVPLTPDVSNWVQKIPANWKASIAATFEEKETLSEDDRGN